MVIRDSYQGVMLALCIWREARGEEIEGKIAVGLVLRNRIVMAPLQGFKNDYVSNITKPFAFSSFNANDPNASKWPAANDPSWEDCCDAAESVTNATPDTTNGAVFYYSPPLTAPPHSWGNVVQCAKIGNLTFFRLP